MLTITIDHQTYSINHKHVYVPNSSIHNITFNPKCNIKQLELSYNSLAIKGACNLAGYLFNNATLEMLGLWGNGIQDEEPGAISIANALCSNSHLTHLDLGENGITDLGALAIAEMIKVNKSLISIDLGMNHITDIGAKVIASALKMNCTLAAVHFADNPISNEGAQNLINAVSISKQLKLFRLRDIDNEVFKTLPVIDHCHILRLELINFNNTLWLKRETSNSIQIFRIARMLIILDLSFDLKFHILKLLDNSSGKRRSLIFKCILDRRSIGKIVSKNKFTDTELMRQCCMWG